MKYQRSCKKAQVWVETVIYTLIGLAVIGLLLAVAKPKIDSIRDKLLIDQTIDLMNNIDSKIYSVQEAPGNKRIADVKISRGKLVINSKQDEIYWILDSRHQYSQENVEISLGNLKVLTSANGENWLVRLSIKYSVDLRYGNEDVAEFEEAPLPYPLYIENIGRVNNNLVINIGSREQ